MDKFLRSLTMRHKLLDDAVSAERGRDDLDGERLIALKRMKRQIGKQIDYIRREGRPPVEVMVVRKPRRFTQLALKPLR